MNDLYIKRRKIIKVKVPGSSANIGPGFDSLSISLAIYNYIILKIRKDNKINITIQGYGQSTLSKGTDNLIIKIISNQLAKLNYRIPGLDLCFQNYIPQEKGLGSSAAAIVSALLIVKQLVNKDHSSKIDILNEGAKIENHVDNIASSIYGGMNIVWSNKKITKNKLNHSSKYLFFNKKINILKNIKVILAIPNQSLQTQKARSVLPQLLGYEKISANISRTALLIYSLTQDPSYIFQATEDYLHQNYRRIIMKNTFSLLTYLRSFNIPAVISGAGPSILIFSISEKKSIKINNLIKYFCKEMKNNNTKWTIKNITIYLLYTKINFIKIKIAN